jgi:hypothetical protein
VIDTAGGSDSDVKCISLGAGGRSAAGVKNHQIPVKTTARRASTVEPTGGRDPPAARDGHHMPAGSHW